jgi:hypothetical protein
MAEMPKRKYVQVTVDEWIFLFIASRRIWRDSAGSFRSSLRPLRPCVSHLPISASRHFRGRGLTQRRKDRPATRPGFLIPACFHRIHRIYVLSEQCITIRENGEPLCCPNETISRKRHRFQSPLCSLPYLPFKIRPSAHQTAAGRPPAKQAATAGRVSSLF